MRMQAWITPYAAMGLATAVICAVGYHLMLVEGRMMVPSMILGVIAGYVAYGRDKVVPFKDVREAECARHWPAGRSNYLGCGFGDTFKLHTTQKARPMKRSLRSAPLFSPG